MLGPHEGATCTYAKCALGFGLPAQRLAKPLHLIKKPECILLLLVVLGSLFLTGCATTETDNLSVRPWNSPNSWESGLPAGMMEGR